MGNLLRILRYPLTAWLVLGVSLLISCLAWNLSYQYSEHEAQERFRHEADVSLTMIQDRMLQYQQLLRASAAVAESGAPSRTSWHRLFEQINPFKYFPGTQGLGYSAIVSDAQKPSFEAQIRKQGFPEFAIKPEGQRDQYCVVTLIEPFDWRNRRAFGFDGMSEPTRTEAITHARDSGEITLSGKVRLLQETEQDVQAGFIMYLPIYRYGQPTDTVEARRKAINGFVYAPFRTNDLMVGVLGHKAETIAFDLYDETQPGDNGLLYRSPLMQQLIENQHPIQFSQDESLEVAGRTWRVHFSGSQAFENSTHSFMPTIIGLGSIFCDLLLFMILLLLNRNQRLLSGQTSLLKNVFKNAPMAIVMTDSNGRIVKTNALFESVFGYAPKEIAGKKIEQLLPQHLRRQHKAHRQLYFANPNPPNPSMTLRGELQGRHKDGHIIPVEVGLNKIEVGRRSFVLASVVDISVRKEIEAERTAMAERIREMAYHDPLTNLPNRRLLSERLSQALIQAKRTGQWGGVLFIDLDEFKQLNDSQGHDFGDLLLVEVANRLKHCVREMDTVARLGGDEFIVLFPVLTEDFDSAQLLLSQLGQKIIDSLKTPCQFNHQQHTITLSIGATVFCGEDDMTEIFKQADTAMYDVKKSGRNAFRLFNALQNQPE